MLSMYFCSFLKMKLDYIIFHLSSSLHVQQSSQKGGILSRLVQQIPLVFSFWGRQHQRPTDSRKDNVVEMSYPSDVIGSFDFDEGTNRTATDVMDDNFSDYVEVLKPELCSNNTNLYSSRFYSLSCVAFY